ncbi:hypothetical protein FB567DRAFT_568068 [Paraphoma chrysanthemicola]|uniref:Phosphatidate phosphatase APP1 catalytic domain-containing protein n=1 Tax=Paraphoma chrysanthemicola TaxID=798071 RepID=A0A8K0W1W2_9PLEO|nr:hypothetical protein FB567DRAFT_568068 [Paraphoma chrysanthemicola]
MAAMYRVFKNKWVTPPKPVDEDYSGRTIIITGSTSGIGEEAAYKFAALGASKVIITARDMAKGESTKNALEARLKRKDQLEVWELDMMSYDSIKAFAKQANTLEHLDIAVLNAGTRRTKFYQSAHGWEEDLQVNTLSTMLLALLLLPKLKESKQHTGKIPILEFVNSGLHQNAIVPDDVLTESNVLSYYNTKDHFAEGKQYKYSKVFLMYASQFLADQVSSGDVIVTSVCPGWANTNLGRDHFFPGVFFVAFFFILIFMRTAAQGANMILSGTTQGEKVHGRFWQHDQIQPIAPSLKGDGMRNLASRVVNEILDALKEGGLEVESILDDAHHRLRLFIGRMPKSPFRRKPSAHGPSSLLRYLFPRTRARARDGLSKFRHETFPSLKHRAQSRIYKYIVYRQALRLKRKPSILQRLRGHTRKLISSSSYLENEVQRRRRDIAQGINGTNKGAMSYQESYEPRESGGRRRKLAGYLKAANELRQTYTAQYAPSWRGNEENYRFEDDTPGEFPDAAVVRSGEEEMILFPSYARKHIKKKPEAEPGTIQESEGEGRDVRDTTGAGDAEFWKKQWEEYEDDHAVVDVDVRGWIYTPFKGQMSRKQRLFIGLARQLVGIQAPPAGATGQNSSSSSRDPSPGHPMRDAHRERQTQRDEQLAAREAEQILRKGEKEAAVAAKGGYSERPSRGDEDDTQLYRTQSRDSVRTMGSLKAGQLSHATSRSSLKDHDHYTPLQKRASWNHPDDMNASELAEANSRLMTRLRHFLAVPMANTPISIFFYNEKISKQRTIYTNAAGHFSMSAALDFVPTHVRILASDKLSATEEVIVTDSKGISVISDIDDTIKHSAISSGAREIFRNAFIRDLGDLTIDGVKEWYTAMADLGVKFHYVSNSPWQLFPVISHYFALAGLPPGSFHLKQYSGMLQGIFEPVAERKKSTLDKIARDFPERNFILIGDSGEADLEVYTDFVLENPGRVVAVFIRDVTTPEHGGFFDPSIGSAAGGRSSSASPDRAGSMSKKAQTDRGRPTSEEHDPELKAAIAASIRAMEQDDLQRSKSMFPQIDEDHPELRPQLPARKPSSTTSQRTPDVPNLIDLSSDDEPQRGPLRRANTDSKTDTYAHRMSTTSIASNRSAPPPPRKPAGLRSTSADNPTSNAQSPSSPRPPPPPKPRMLSNSVNQPSPLSQQASTTRSATTLTPSRPTVPSKPSSISSSESQSEQSYAGMARDKLWSVYNNLPALRSTDGSETQSSTTTDSGTRRNPPPPPPPRRRDGARDGAASAVSYVGNKASSAWQHAPSVPYHSRPQIPSAQTSQPYSTTAQRQGLNRSNTGSTLGMNGGAPDGEPYGTKREQMWRQRWARAEEIMRQHGVRLISWRVGTDAVGEAERIIREAEGRGKGGASGAGGGGKGSKGKPTDPKLREKVKEDVKAETNKDGSGKGQWSAWKAAKLSKEYEKKGGGYENEAGSRNEPKKGTPQPKSSGKKKAEEKPTESKSESPSSDDEEKEAPPSEQKPKANSSKKKDQATDAKKSGTKGAAKDATAKKEGTLKGKGKERTEGTRKSSRISEKRKTDSEDAAPAKKRKST